MTEEWRAHPDDDGYQISSLGSVRGPRGKILKISGHNIYGTVPFRRTKIAYVHHLVARAFLGPRPEGAEIRHLDGNCRNNAATNLAYGTRQENVQDSLRHGTHQPSARTTCRRRHLYTEENTYWYRGHRTCRECVRINQRAYYRRRQGQ